MYYWLSSNIKHIFGLDCDYFYAIKHDAYTYTLFVCVKYFSVINSYYSSGDIEIIIIQCWIESYSFSLYSGRLNKKTQEEFSIGLLSLSTMQLENDLVLQLLLFFFPSIGNYAGQCKQIFWHIEKKRRFFEHLSRSWTKVKKN